MLSEFVGGHLLRISLREDVGVGQVCCNILFFFFCSSQQWAEGESFRLSFLLLVKRGELWTS